jgi:hypothetical protein
MITKNMSRENNTVFLKGRIGKVLGVLSLLAKTDVVYNSRAHKQHDTLLTSTSKGSFVFLTVRFHEQSLAVLGNMPLFLFTDNILPSTF